MHKVAITGIGIVSCLGNTPETVGESLRRGKSGIVFDPERERLGFQSPLTSIIRDFRPRESIPRKHRKGMPEFAVQTCSASLDALEMAGLSEKDIQNPETGMIFGCDSSSESVMEQVELLQKHRDTRMIGSGLTFRTITSTITMNMNTFLKTKGACWTISSACSSGGHAVGQAADLIALGRQERIICGGAQEISWQSMCSLDGLGAFSKRLHDPEAACRPFDADRDGLVPGGGAAAIVLEQYECAQKRGAEILGLISAYSFSSDGFNISVPSKDGIFRAMADALKRAEMEPKDIDYICAHATSTPAGDTAEAENINALFGLKTPLISSIKSMTGHELWMTGASQVVYSVIMARQGFIAPNINFEKPDDTTRHLNIVTETIKRPPRNVMCNSAGFGGTNSCLILDFS